MIPKSTLLVLLFSRGNLLFFMIRYLCFMKTKGVGRSGGVEREHFLRDLGSGRLGVGNSWRVDQEGDKLRNK